MIPNSSLEKREITERLIWYIDYNFAPQIAVKLNSSLKFMYKDADVPMLSFLLGYRLSSTFVTIKIACRRYFAKETENTAANSDKKLDHELGFASSQVSLESEYAIYIRG